MHHYRNNGRSLLGLDDEISTDNDVYKSHTINSEQMLEQNNDERLNTLGEKVKTIKLIAVDIESQVAESNKLLDDMVCIYFISAVCMYLVDSLF